MHAILGLVAVVSGVQRDQRWDSPPWETLGELADAQRAACLDHAG